MASHRRATSSFQVAPPLVVVKTSVHVFAPLGATPSTQPRRGEIQVMDSARNGPGPPP
jgi:hypothetical protein